MKKRVLSAIMALVLSLSLLPAAALAEEGEEETPIAQQQEIDVATENGAEEEASLEVRDGETVMVSTEAELVSALENDAQNTTVRLSQDITLTLPITIQNKTVTLDMDGHIITLGAVSAPHKWVVFDIEGNSNITICGNGGIVVSDGYMDHDGLGYTFRLFDTAHLTIENGIFECGLTCIQLAGTSSADILGGAFSARVDWNGKFWILNRIDETDTAFRVYGGTFTNYDPSNSETENPTDNFCADGHVSVQEGDDYVVMPIEEAAVAQVDGEYYLTLQDAIDAAGEVAQESEERVTITLLTSATGDAVTFDRSGNYLLDLNNCTYTSTNAMDVFKVCAGDMDLTIQNGGLVGHGTYAYGIYVYALDTNGDGAADTPCDNVTVTLDHVDLDVTDQGLGVQGINSSNSLIVKNSTVNAATAIYFPPKSGKLTIENSVITGVNNAIVIKGGNVDISGEDTVIRATGPADEIDEPYEGDPNDPESFPHSGAAVYVESGYNDRDIVVEIKGGCLSSQYDRAIRMFLEPDVAVTVKRDIIVTGGYFTSDPSEYVPDNYYTVASDIPGYSWMVTDTEPSTAPVVVTENVEAGVAENATISEDEKAAISDVIDSASVSGVADALNDSAKNDIVAAANIRNDILNNSDNTVVVEIGVTVTATSANLSDDDNATITYRVTPTATVTVRGADNTSVENLSMSNSYLSGRAFTVRLPLPAGLGTPKEVMHIAENGSRERFTGNELTIGPNWVEVRISHFSELVVNAQETVAAKIGGTSYGTLQEAVNAARSGDTIELQADCSERITISGKSVTIDLNGHEYSADLVTVGSRCEKTVSGNQIVVTYTAPPTSSGSSSDPSYSPVLDVSDGGTVQVNPRTPSEDDEVTITVEPDSGYEVGEVTVTDRNGREIDVTAGRNNTYTFIQPRGRVTISVTFVREGSGTFFADVPETFWAYDEIKWAYDSGYVNGTSASAFSPNASISRQQVWMILARLSGADPADMAAARTWAMANSVSDGTNPGGAITRQQLVALLYRYAQMMGYANDARVDLASFPDAGSVAGYAVEPLQWSVANSIVGGTSDGALNPTGTATRAQFAVILYRFWSQIG